MNDILDTTGFFERFGEPEAGAGETFLGLLRAAYREAGLTPAAADEAALADYVCGFATEE